MKYTSARPLTHQKHTRDTSTHTHKMAPAANTARQRRVLGSARAAAESDSDAEYRAYNSRLREASAARTRLRKVRHHLCTVQLSTQKFNASLPGATNPRQEPYRARHGLRRLPHPNRVPHHKVGRQAQGPAVGINSRPPLSSPSPLFPPITSPLPHPTVFISNNKDANP